MKMVDDRKEDAALEALFGATRSQTPEVSDDFLARLVADAEASVPVPAPRPSRPTPLFGNLKAWFAASGLSGAAVLGLWIGFIMPDVINTFQLATTDETVGLYTFLPGADLAALEVE